MQIQDSTGATVVIRTLQTGTSPPYGIGAVITQAYLCDANGNPISTIAMPSATNPVIPELSFSVTNDQVTTQSLLVTVNVFDSDGVPISANSQLMSDVVSGGSVSSIVDFSIPSWANYGTAYAYVGVYSNWPAQGGVPLGVEYIFPFSITGGAAVQGGTLATTSSETGNPNNFNMQYRLAPDGVFGTYNIYTTTNYLGITGSQTASFAVAQLADVNGDGVVNFHDVTYFVANYINYYNNGVYTPSIDFIHDGSVINFKDVEFFIAYYIAAMSEP
jgi:hypothetical protein